MSAALGVSLAARTCAGCSSPVFLPEARTCTLRPTPRPAALSPSTLPDGEIEVFLGHAAEGLAAVLRTERRRFHGRVPRRASEANMSRRRGTTRRARRVGRTPRCRKSEPSMPRAESNAVPKGLGTPRRRQPSVPARRPRWRSSGGVAHVRLSSALAIRGAPSGESLAHRLEMGVSLGEGLELVGRPARAGRSHAGA